MIFLRIGVAAFVFIFFFTCLVIAIVTGAAVARRMVMSDTCVCIGDGGVP